MALMLEQRAGAPLLPAPASFAPTGRSVDMELAEASAKADPRLTVGIAADSDVARHRIGNVVEAAGIALAGVCGQADAAGLAGKVDAMVVFADPRRRAEAAVIRAVSQAAAAPVLVVVASSDRRASDAALRAGARGVVLDSQVEHALAATIHAVCCGQLVVPQELSARFATPALSFREKQVLGLVVMGYTNGEIARTLYLAESTVKSHLSSSFEKLGVRSRNEAARLIVDESNGLGTGILTITGAEPIAAQLG
jgi:DNA-binding NarL/FixJ family response regulator